jgi:hypothetical protein
MARRTKKSTRVNTNGGRLNLNIDPMLKRWLTKYADRKHTSITSIVVNYFVELREKDESGDVEQI